MGIFGNIKNAVVKGVKDAGHAVGKVADNKYAKLGTAGILALTGVGAPAAAAILAGQGLAGGALKPGGNIGSALKGGATGAVSGLAAAKAGQALKLGGIGGLIKGGGSDGKGNFGLAGELAGKVAGPIGLGGAGGGGNILDLGLGAAGMYNSAQLGQKSTDYATGALDTANQNWKSREPLRLAGVSGMLNPTPTSDVSQIGARARATNPFATKALPLPVKV